jgi:putative endonuclease
MKMNQYFVYIMASRQNGTLYVGVTNNLLRRVYEHREGILDGFSKKYDIKRLVYYEIHQDIKEAIAREKRIKSWKRDWKLRLIEEANPEWKDLYEEML